MAHFAGWREIGVKFPMRAASVDPKSTQLTPLTLAWSNTVCGVFGFVFTSLCLTVFDSEIPAAKTTNLAPTLWFLQRESRSDSIFGVFDLTKQQIEENPQQKTQQVIRRARPETDFLRLVSSKLVVRGGSCRPGLPF